MTRVVVIGGGAVGLSVAWHLVKRGASPIVVERNQISSGTSWHAAGIVGPLRATVNMTRLAMAALETFPRLKAETGMSLGFRRTGGYWLARVQARMDELRRISDLGRYMGFDASFVDLTDLDFLDHKGLVGALHVAEDAAVDPVGLCQAYARAAKACGCEIRENSSVKRIIMSADRATGVELSGGERIMADAVAICAGAWSRPLAESVGLKLPLQAVEHMYVVTEPIKGLPNPFPVLRDLDTGIYVKGDAGRLVIGGFERDAKCWDAFGPEGDRPFLELPEDWSQFAPFMDAALSLIPSLETTGIQRFMNGPESFTADTKPLIGAAPHCDGLYVAAGMNSVGVMSSAGVGRALADWIVDKTQPCDLWEVDVARADPLSAQPGHLIARMEEAVADQFALHWPYKQSNAGRGLRQSDLHDRWKEQGAVFGLTGGWERALWFRQSDAERDMPYSVGKQAWWPIVAREATVLTDGAAMLDLSPFSKFEISGAMALENLSRLTCANIDVEVGRVVWALLLNHSGGIEADVTIARLGKDHFRVTGGAATRWRDLALLRRGLARADVNVEDVTEAHCVIGLMGSGARRVLADASDGAVPNIAFSHAASVELAGVRCTATRLSFVGEFGYELAVPTSDAARVFDVLRRGGAALMGHYAVEACRLEKGFVHWGHDIGPEISPLEAGLGFAVDWNKEFVGKQDLDQQLQAGLTRRLTLFDVEGEPLLLHDEPIWEAGRVVGLTTSGARGPRTGRDLCFGLISVELGENKSATAERSFEIQVAGERYPARALIAPPFDPSGERMRA